MFDFIFLYFLVCCVLLFCSFCHIVRLSHLIKQEAFEKCWAHSLLRAVLHCHLPGVATATTVARRLRIDVHDDDDDDDNDNDNA